jgi:glycosyltransferase involved in cell wall biosynthesis
MDIGVDASCWWNQRGFGRFTRELLKAMFAEGSGHRFWLFIDQPPEPEMAHPDVQIVEVGARRPVTESAVAARHRSSWDLLHFCRALARSRLDVMFFPAVYSWFPVLKRIPSVVTFHDAIAEHFPHLVFPNRQSRRLWSLKVRLARLQARRLLTVSQAARDEIVRYLAVDPSCIDVVCEGADHRFRPVHDAERRVAARLSAGLPTDEPFLIYVGGIAPHKNLGRLLDGFAIAATEPGLKKLHLALVGDPGGAGFHSNYGELLARTKTDARLVSRVHFTGFVADDVLAALYSDALAAVLPSVSEGFGLPVLEAMSCGTPVLTSDVGAAPEVAGDGGLRFDPADPSAIARTICTVAGDAERRAILAKRALARSGTYSWQRGAALALSTLERCARER